MAEFMKMPLDSIINSNPSFIPRIFSARQLYMRRYVPFNTNKQRYGIENSDGELEMEKFEAATVSIDKVGYHKKVWKIDVNQMYPRLLSDFNLGPDTTKILKTDILTGNYSFKKEKDKLIIEIPDNNWKKQIFLEVDNTRDGFISTSFNTFFTMRKEYKKLAKDLTLSPEERLQNESRSTSIKILMNSEYGMMGNTYANWGDLATAVATVSIGRYVIAKMISLLGNTVIAVDTDGVYTDEKVDVDKLTNDIKNIIKNECFINSNIDFDLDEYGSGWFYKAKNYVLEDLKNNKIILHGVSFKSKAKPPYHDKVVTMVARMVLDGKTKNQIYEKLKNFKQFTGFELDDFIMKTSYDTTKDYKNPNALQPALAKIATEQLGRKLRKGDSIEYAKTKTGYKIKEQVKSMAELDDVYYIDLLDKTLGIFHLNQEDINQSTFDF